MHTLPQPLLYWNSCSKEDNSRTSDAASVNRSTTDGSRLPTPTSDGSEPLCAFDDIEMGGWKSLGKLDKPDDSSSCSEPLINVWASNLEVEMARLRETLELYRYVAFDTEYPGFVVKAASGFQGTVEERSYENLRDNINTIKLIQLGICCRTATGEAGEDRCWQFHFRFDKENDEQSESSIKLLTNARIQWGRHKREGIHQGVFAQLFRQTFMNNDNELGPIRYISFHGMCDFAFFVILASQWPLPDTLEEFLERLDKYFPFRCDLKFFLNFSGSLQQLGSMYDVPRIGTAHQAGSDALMTSGVYFALPALFREKVFAHGALFGLHSAACITLPSGWEEEKEYLCPAESDEWYAETTPSVSPVSSYFESTRGLDEAKFFGGEEYYATNYGYGGEEFAGNGGVITAEMGEFYGENGVGCATREVPEFYPGKNITREVPEFSPGKNITREMPDFLPGKNITREVPEFLPGKNITRAVPEFLPGKNITRAVPEFYPGNSITREMPEFYALSEAEKPVGTASKWLDSGLRKLLDSQDSNDDPINEHITDRWDFEERRNGPFAERSHDRSNDDPNPRSFFTRQEFSGYMEGYNPQDTMA